MDRRRARCTPTGATCLQIGALPFGLAALTDGRFLRPPLAAVWLMNWPPQTEASRASRDFAQIASGPVMPARSFASASEPSPMLPQSFTRANPSGVKTDETQPSWLVDELRPTPLPCESAR